MRTLVEWKGASSLGEQGSFGGVADQIIFSVRNDMQDGALGHLILKQIRYDEHQAFAKLLERLPRRVQSADACLGRVPDASLVIPLSPNVKGRLQRSGLRW